MLVRKTNPKGLDKLIDKIQLKLNNQLDLGIWENNHRAYRNPKQDSKRGFIAELYTENGNYRECYYDDNFDAVSFFFASDKSEIVDGKIKQDFSLIFHVDINAIYPTITHRADEELKMHVLTVLNSFSNALFSVNDIDTGIQNVYKEFEFENIKFEDMSNLFCVRFNMTAYYVADCCLIC
jgi:hypothetical protein